MSAQTVKTIVLSGDPEYHEGIAKSAIKPGQLLELTGAKKNGAGGSLQAHSSAAGPAVPMFAVENPSLPINTEGSHNSTLAAIEGTIPAGDTFQYIVARPGDVLYGWLDSADTGGNGEGTVAAGDAVESDGSGDLVNTNGGTTHPVAVAYEGAVSPDSSTPKRAKFLVI